MNESAHEVAASSSSMEDSPVKEKSKKPTNFWLPGWTADHVESILKNTVHFSSKAVSSTSAPIGVRVGSEQFVERRTLPYVGVTTLGASHVPTDYCQSAALEGKVVNRTHSVLYGNPLEKYDNVAMADYAAFHEGSQCLTQPFELGTHRVEMRLRQILWPLSPDTDYLALTPLHSTGLSFLMDRKVRDEFSQAFNSAPRTGDKKLGFAMPRRLAAITGYGGANSQNVGALAGSMQSPLVFLPPRESPEIRKALSLYHNGISPSNFHRVLDRFSQWWHNRGDAGDDTPKNMQLREQERRWAMRIADRILALGEDARKRVQRAIDSGLVDELTSPALSVFMRGLIDPQYRSAAWRHDFGMYVVNAMARHRPLAVQPDGTRRRVEALGPDDLFVSLYQAAKGRSL